MRVPTIRIKGPCLGGRPTAIVLRGTCSYCNQPVYNNQPREINTVNGSGYDHLYCAKGVDNDPMDQ